jgi:thiol-disulfide isomerase/thioredoxin
MVQHWLGCGLLLLALRAVGGELAVGQVMPVVEAKLLDGTPTLRVGGGPGKVTIVNFWATWCAPCRAEMPDLQTYYERHKSQGLEVLAISMDEPRDLAAVRRVAQGFTFPVALKADANFKGLGRIWRMPSTFVVDRHGILRKNGHEGKPSVDLELLEAEVTPLLQQP